MPQAPNKITKFWLELKRRKVIKVIALYAATALLLPSWTLTLVIVLLAIGFIRIYRKWNKPLPVRTNNQSISPSYFRQG